MAPLKKKSKKFKKDLKKLKKSKSVNLVPIEPRPIESDWWDSFRHKSSSTPGLCGSLLSNKCKNMHESPSTPSIVTTNEEEDSDVIDWIIKAFGCISGFAVGCAIGKYFTDRNHEWFVETFGGGGTGGRGQDCKEQQGAGVLETTFP